MLSSEIDALAAYCAELDTCYFVPVTLASNRRQIHLRLSPCKNNQRLAINWAKMYEFRSIDWEQLSSLGAIAQLGERLSGTQEVAGSSPASSTDLKLTLRSVRRSRHKRADWGQPDIPGVATLASIGA